VYQKRGELLLLTDRREALERLQQQLEEAKLAQQAAAGRQPGGQ